MTPLERVTAAAGSVRSTAQALDVWRDALRSEARAAVRAGIPQTRVAAAAGVDRNTIARWVKEESQ